MEAIRRSARDTKEEFLLVSLIFLSSSSNDFILVFCFSIAVSAQVFTSRNISQK